MFADILQLPDQGLCSTEEDYEVKILSFGMGRVFARHASGSHCPLPGFCSVTKDREGRVYVYFCQDDDVHWMHMLEVGFGDMFVLFAHSHSAEHGWCRRLVYFCKIV